MVAHQTMLTVGPMKMGHVLQTYNQQARDAATANPKQDHQLQQDKPTSTSHSLLPTATPPTRQIYQPQRACIKRCQSPHPIRSWIPMMRATPRCQHVACSTRPQPGVHACSFATSYISKQEGTSPSKHNHNDTLSVLNPTLTPPSRTEAAK